MIMQINKFKLLSSHTVILNQLFNSSRRFKGNSLKKNLRYPKKTNCDKALEYYDTVYPPVYGKSWWDMKEALLEDPKYTSLVNNFSDTDDVVKTFEEQGAYDVGAFYTKTIRKKKSKLNVQKPISPSRLEETDENSNLKSIRPSLIELTEDEKAALSSSEGIDRYPSKYRERREAIKENFSRVVKASQIGKDKSIFNYDHIPPTKMKGFDDWSEDKDVFLNANDSESDIGVKRETESAPIKWPENLKLYSFVKGETLEFPSPLPSRVLSTYTHYLMNGASILPVLALDIQNGDRILDMCSSPGGKSLAILQTYLPEFIVCNDLSKSRLRRQETVFDQYIPKDLTAIRSIIHLSQGPGQYVTYPDYFDKVLVDAPCLNDRLSVQEPDNNIFKSGRIKERHQMPDLQSELILSALKSVKPGGCVVYSTCTLSPLQNDGAVHLALTKVWRSTKIDCTVLNLEPTMRNLRFMFEFGKERINIRYGHIILPTSDNNFGPMYICKIRRDR